MTIAKECCNSSHHSKGGHHGPFRKNRPRQQMAVVPNKTIPSLPRTETARAKAERRGKHVRRAPLRPCNRTAALLCAAAKKRIATCLLLPSPRRGAQGHKYLVPNFPVSARALGASENRVRQAKQSCMIPPRPAIKIAPPLKHTTNTTLPQDLFCQHVFRKNRPASCRF